MRFKKVIGKIHLWLGFLSGIVVFIVAVTGCIYVFKDEIETLSRPYQYAKTQNKPLLSPTQLKEAATKNLPDKIAGSVTYRKGYAAVVRFDNDDHDYYYNVYINPYSGEVIKIKDEKNDFFDFILTGHYNLWLPEKTGKLIVASATLIFVISLISGFILWWPNNKAARKQRFKFQWKATTKWRRKNYDLHNILGFYTSVVTLIIALTGLVWGFEWFSEGLRAVLVLGNRQEKIQKDLKPYIDPGDYAISTSAENYLWRAFNKKNADFEGSYEIGFSDDKESDIWLYINHNPGTYWKTDYLTYSAKDLREENVRTYKNMDFSDKVFNMNYDIHVGAIGGLPTKILAFGASLIAASLPITGFIIWRGRRKRIRYGLTQNK